MNGGGELDLLTGLLSLVLVIGAILLLAWGARRFQLPLVGRSGAVRVISSTPLGPRERLVVADVAGKQLLLGVTSSQISLLHELEQPLDTPPERASFADTLGRMKKSS